MTPLAVTALEGGVLVFQSELWATNSVLVPAGDGCVVCDPSIFPDEIEEIRGAACAWAPCYVFVTHSDFDHICGAPAFADATVVAGARTADAVRDGTAQRALDDAGRDWGTVWRGELRVDVVAGPEPMRCAGATVLAVETTGHAGDGAAFVICERGLLVAGDYLSAACHPIVLSSVDAALASTARLMAAIDTHGITTVVPGHGPVLDHRAATRIGREDIAYLRALQAAAADVARRGVGPDDALSMVRGVTPPRPALADLEALDLLSSNAVVALAEAGHAGFQPSVTR